MLTALHHPCQALADLMTMRESFGGLAGLRLAYVGDGTNVARSLAILGTLAGMDIAIASPPGYTLEDDLSLPPGAAGTLTLYQDPHEAAAGAHALYTDVWVSMGEESSTDRQSEESPIGQRAARHLRPTGSMMPCSTRPRPRRSLCTACLPTRARRSPPRCSTARVSASGIRPRTAATRRRRCWSCWSSPHAHERAHGHGREARHQRARRSAFGGSRPERATEAPRARTADRAPDRSLAHGGEGVARFGDGGYVVFVSGAVPGDRVRAGGHKRKRSYAHARVRGDLAAEPRANTRRWRTIRACRGRC